MKICMITFQYPPFPHGGVGVAVHRLARNLAKSGVQLHIIAPGNHQLGEPFSVSVEENLIVHRTYADLAKFHSEQASAQEFMFQEIGDYIVKLHRAIHFDLVHGIFLVSAGLIAAVVAKEIGRPLVASIRGSDWERMRFSPLLSASVRWVVEQATIITAVSSELYHKAQSLVSIPNARVIPNIFDPSLFNPHRLEALKCQPQAVWWRAKKPCNKKIIGTVGILRHVKGYAVLLEAFHTLLNKRPDIFLLIVGNFDNQDEKNRWHQLVDRFGLAHHTYITGKIEHRQILAWINEIDLFVFPSLHEGSPNALLEAMACGRPLVASQTGGIVDFVEDKKNGLLVPPGCATALARKIQQLLSDEQLSRCLGKAAKASIANQYLPHHEVELWRTTYLDAIRLGSKPKKPS